MKLQKIVQAHGCMEKNGNYFHKILRVRFFNTKSLKTITFAKTTDKVFQTIKSTLVYNLIYSFVPCDFVVHAKIKPNFKIRLINYRR